MGTAKAYGGWQGHNALRTILGYRKGEDGLPEIVPEEAKVVRMIYRSFMDGLSYYKIAQLLMKRNIPAPSGGEKWHRRTVESILTNEKYKGSALLQKKFTVDFLTKKQKVNEGEVPQYFIEDSHPPIIDPQEFGACAGGNRKTKRTRQRV